MLTWVSELCWRREWTGKSLRMSPTDESDLSAACSACGTATLSVLDRALGGWRNDSSAEGRSLLFSKFWDLGLLATASMAPVARELWFKSCRFTLEGVPLCCVLVRACAASYINLHRPKEYFKTITTIRRYNWYLGGRSISFRCNMIVANSNTFGWSAQMRCDWLSLSDSWRSWNRCSTSSCPTDTNNVIIPYGRAVRRLRQFKWRRPCSQGWRSIGISTIFFQTRVCSYSIFFNVRVFKSLWLGTCEFTVNTAIQT